MHRERSPHLSKVLFASTVAIVLAGSTGLGTATPPPATAAPQGQVVEYQTTEDTIYPEFFHPPAAQLSDEQMRDLRERLEAKREAVLAGSAELPIGPAAAGEVVGEPSVVAEDLPQAEPGLPAASLLWRENRRNSQGDLASELAEPVAVANGVQVLAGGNTHFEFSPNRTTTWTNIPFGAGPADAPIPCCDPDVQHDWGRGVSFYVILYVNNVLTNGAVRIHVRPHMTSGNACTYTLGTTGTALPDYPHIALSNDFLYLATNDIDNTSGWTGARVRRIDAHSMANCVTASLSTFVYGPASTPPGQRVFVGAEGATETMFFVSQESTTQMRVFQWAEANASPTSNVVSGLNTSAFVNPDCRGGAGNFDWIERATAYREFGFRHRAAVRKSNQLAVYWNVGPDGTHTQGHVHAALFNVSTTVATLVGQPHIWNNSYCWGFPAVSTNHRGDLGFSIGFGGVAGGGGNAAQGAVGIDDDFSGAIGNPGIFYLTAFSMRNASNNRHGDYYTVRPYHPCTLAFTATNYGLQPTVVNVRFVNFMRGRELYCYLEWRPYPPRPF